MNDRGGYLNGSGYPDPTAYKAMNRMEDKMKMEVKRGEIWHYMVAGCEREGIVVGIDRNLIAVYQLMDDGFDGSIPVTRKGGIGYIQPGRISYTQVKWLNDYVQDVSEEKMKEITDAMRRVFDLPEDTSYPVYDASSSEASEEAEKLRAENQKLMDALKESEIRARLMTDQYNMLLDRMLGRANG